VKSGLLCDGRRARWSGEESQRTADVSKRKKSKHSARAECGVVFFLTLSNYIEREPNRRESCPPNQCHSAELDAKDVGDDLLYLGVPLLDDVTLGRGFSMRSWPSSSLRGVECMYVME
jgi:hypothetical protein